MKKTNPTHVRLAACRYPIERHRSFDAYVAKLRKLVHLAVAQKAQMLVFPEYASVELTALLPLEQRRDLLGLRTGLQPYLNDYLGLFAELAKESELYIVAGTFLELEGTQFRNRAYLFGPDGESRYQDKLHLTAFESGEWQLSPGDRLNLFDTRYGKVGINICYDVQFPAVARELVKAGAEILLVPSATDTPAGFERVRLGCRARAMENQCYVVHSCTTGKAAWCEALDLNTGHAGIYAPMDNGFPSDGRIATGQTRWVVAELDLSRLNLAREQGEVHNLLDDHPRRWDLKRESI